jgi:hypothetical protein
MKRKFLTITILGLILIPAMVSAETANVITKENAIRKDCKFFSPVRAKVKYEDELEILSRKGDWFLVKFGRTKGCIHKSAIEKKEFSLSGLLGSGGDASSDEVALAGKGFNPQVESSYKKKHPDLNFGLVDEIEGYTVLDEKLKNFIKKGGLKLP